MTAQFSHDAAMTAIFGFFAMVWFGWAQEHPPQSWKKWLIVGSVLAPSALGRRRSVRAETLEHRNGNGRRH